MEALDTTQLAGLIAQKEKCLVHLRDLVKRQLALIVDGEISQLLKVLSAKQQLIGKLRTLEKSLAPFQHQDPESRRWRSREDRAACAERAAACKALLAEIVEAEKTSEHRLASRRDEIARRLHATHTAARARGAYQNDASSAIGMLDVASEQ